MRAILPLAGALTIFATKSVAGPVGSACLSSGRSPSQPLCACIQNVADMTLDGRDQKLAARLMADPEKAEAVRVSDSSRNKDFWARYQGFADAAGTLCVPG
ncbi:MAG TPA: hypothetical protein PLI43_19445 [Albidovulum sp.]|uniref:hypothetical protein n=1 Tax=Albidovulum sp. TaxID=1872424 RepID=UPI002BF45D92|nr:hypothetical protein [Albidovulum sp.]